MARKLTGDTSPETPNAFAEEFARKGLPWLVDQLEIRDGEIKDIRAEMKMLKDAAKGRSEAAAAGAQNASGSP
jgi:hypothetical protein